MVDGIREEAGIWSSVGFLLLDVAWWHNPSVFIMFVLSLLPPLKPMLGWFLSPPEQHPHFSAQQPHAVVSFPVFSLLGSSPNRKFPLDVSHIFFLILGAAFNLLLWGGTGTCYVKSIFFLFVSRTLYEPFFSGFAN
jgi:hypothetical protein